MELLLLFSRNARVVVALCGKLIVSAGRLPYLAIVCFLRNRFTFDSQEALGLHVASCLLTK